MVNLKPKHSLAKFTVEYLRDQGTQFNSLSKVSTYGNAVSKNTYQPYKFCPNGEEKDAMLKLVI